MYNFVDKAGFAVTLRPEMTPSLARMVLGRTSEAGDTKMLLPVKYPLYMQYLQFAVRTYTVMYR